MNRDLTHTFEGTRFRLGVMLIGWVALTPGSARLADGAALPDEALDNGAQEGHRKRLIDALAHDDAYKVRLQAAVLLGRSGDKQAVEPLLSALATDADASVRAAAAMGLGTLGDTRAIAPLMRRLALDSDTFVRDQAALALSKYPHERALPHVMATYGSEEPAVRRQVLLYLSQESGPVMEPVLTSALGDAPEVFAVAAKAFVRMPAADALRILEQATAHREPAVRRGAVQVLHQLGSREATRLILGVYEREVEVDEVRQQARTGLRELRQWLPLQQIVAEAHGGDKRSRARALKLLGILGGDTAQQSLLEALRADDLYIRGTAILALADLGDPTSADPIRRLADDPANQRIMHLIRHALAQLQQRPVERVDSSP